MSLPWPVPSGRDRSSSHICNPTWPSLLPGHRPILCRNHSAREPAQNGQRRAAAISEFIPNVISVTYGTIRRVHRSGFASKLVAPRAEEIDMENLHAEPK